MSRFFKLNIWDFIKGALIAAGTAAFTALGTILNTGRLPELPELKAIGIAALAAFVAYLIKNLFTNSSGGAGPEK